MSPFKKEMFLAPLPAWEQNTPPPATPNSWLTPVTVGLDFPAFSISMVISAMADPLYLYLESSSLVITLLPLLAAL